MAPSRRARRMGGGVSNRPFVMTEAAIPDVTEDAGDTLAQFTDFIDQVDPDDFRN